MSAAWSVVRAQLRVLWRVARADLARWVRVPSLIAATLIPALGMGLTVLGLTYAVGRQPVALVQLGRGPSASAVVSAIRGSDGFFLVQRTPQQALKDLKAQRVAGVITVPKTFDQDAFQHRAQLDVLINNVDLDFADDIRRSVSEAVVVTQLGKAAAGEDNEAAEAAASKKAVKSKTPEAHGFGIYGHPNPYHVGLVEKDLRAGDTEFLDYQLVPVLALLALTTGALVTALAIAGDRESGALRILSLAPVSRVGLVLGRLIGGTIASAGVLLVVTVPLALTKALHPPPGRWPMVAATLLLTAIGSTGVGVLIGMITKRVATTVLLGVNVVSASFLLGGGFTTVAFLPAWVQRISHVAPTFYSVDALRQAMFYATTPTFMKDLAVLGLTAVGSVVIGAFALARTSGRAA